MLPVFKVGAAAGLGLLTAAAGFFRRTRDPSGPLPPSVPTLLSQLSTLALFTPPAEVPCGNTQHETIYIFLLIRWLCIFVTVQ